MDIIEKPTTISFKDENHKRKFNKINENKENQLRIIYSDDKTFNLWGKTDNLYPNKIFPVKIECLTPENNNKEYPINSIAQYAGFSFQGYEPKKLHKKNQDELIMVEDTKTNSILLACLDGHGAKGEILSQFFKNEIIKKLFSHPSFKTDIISAIRYILIDAEKLLVENEQHVGNFNGTTLSLVIVRGKRMVVANIGDSRVIIGKSRDDNPQGQVVTRPLTYDHKPQIKSEYDRITSSGGRVYSILYEDGFIGPPRVWLKNYDIPGLAMSRSLGDLVVQKVGVISTPDIYEIEISSNDLFIVLATDGVWDYLDNNEVAKVVSNSRMANLAVIEVFLEEQAKWKNFAQGIDDSTICIAYFK